MSNLLLTILLYSLIAVGIAWPLFFLFVRGRIARQNTRLQHAWRETVNREQDKQDVLEQLELQIKQLVERELKLLDDLGKLRERIGNLNNQRPDPDSLGSIEDDTAQAIANLASLMEAQVDNEQQPRLTTGLDRLAEQHAKNRRALQLLSEAAQQIDHEREAPSLIGRIRRQFYEEKPAPRFKLPDDQQGASQP